EVAALDASLPMESVVLRDINLKVAERLHELRAGREDASADQRAAALSNLVTAQAMAGSRERALHSGQQAVDLYRTLAAERPEVFQPDLASSLNNLATMLSDLGQH